MIFQRSRRRGFSSTDLIALFASALVLLLITSEWLFSQSPNHPGFDNLANRTACFANLRSIAQSMTIYAQSNQAIFPCTPGPSGDNYSNAPQNPTGYAPTQKTNDIIADWYGNGAGPAGASCGNPLACLWQMVLNNQLSTKTFICPSDPLAKGTSLQYINLPEANYANFGVVDNNDLGAPSPVPNLFGQGESYSIADPWLKDKIDADNALHPWAPNGNGFFYAPSGLWINDNRADQPIISDMAPASIKAAGKFNRDTTVSAMQGGVYSPTYLFNSGNHNGAGQNVAFADTHVEWDTSPYVGEQGDNIFTFNTSTTPNVGGTPLSELGTSAKIPNVVVEIPPYDTCMIPIRNVKTGQW